MGWEEGTGEGESRELDDLSRAFLDVEFLFFSLGKRQREERFYKKRESCSSSLSLISFLSNGIEAFLNEIRA